MSPEQIAELQQIVSGRRIRCRCPRPERNWDDGPPWRCMGCGLSCPIPKAYATHLPPVELFSEVTHKRAPADDAVPTTLCGQHKKRRTTVTGRITCVSCIRVAKSFPQLYNRAATRKVWEP